MSYYRWRAERARKDALEMKSAASRLRLLRIACLYDKNAALEDRARRQVLVRRGP